MPLINHFFAVATATLLDDMYTVSEADDFVMICANLTDGIQDRTIRIFLNTFPGTTLGETTSYS